MAEKIKYLWRRLPLWLRLILVFVTAGMLGLSAILPNLPPPVLEPTTPPTGAIGKFGYDQAGSSYQGIGDRISGSIFTCPVDCIAENMSFYVDTDYHGQYFKVKCAIYTSSGTLIAQTEENSDDMNSIVAGWNTLSFPDPKPQLTGGQDYILVVWGNIVFGSYDVDVAYDTETNKGRYVTQTYADNFPSSVSFTTENKKYSIYLTYEEVIQNPSYSNLNPENNYISQPSESITFSAYWTANVGNLSHYIFSYKIGDGSWTNETYSFPSGVTEAWSNICLLYTSPSPRDLSTSRMPSSA